jgi:phage gpG-like protein
MAKPSMKIEFDRSQIDDMINRYFQKTTNPEPLLRAVGKFVRTNTLKMFLTKRPDKEAVRGVRWKPLKPATIEQKKRLKKRGLAIATDRPLVRGGDLKNSLASENALQIRGKETTYGTDVEYARYHQEGGKHLPQRKFLFITKDERQAIARMIKKYLQGAL